MRIGSKKIFHLEAWVVKVMSIYKVNTGRFACCDPKLIHLVLKQHFFYGMDFSAFEE